MPHLEAPQDLSESSPEASLNQDGQAAPGNATLPIAPVAAAQIRLPTPEPRFRVDPEVLLQNQRNLQRTLPRLANFDADVIEFEEENHFPAYVHLLPVVLPAQAPEPTLDELLRRVTSRTDLHNVETVRLRVISYTLSLSHLALFLPRLQQLDLSGSVLCSLRDLGFGLVNLTHLNVSNCGLNSLDGTNGFPTLLSLVADDNMIQRIGSLSDLSLLRHLSVRHNRISELNTLTFLGMCPNLLELDLQANPVCQLQVYRQTMQRSIPSLQVLDGIPLDNTTTTGSYSAHSNQMSSLDSDEVSSLSSTSNSIPQESSTIFRPVTAPASAANCDQFSSNNIAIPRAHSVSAASRSSSLSSGSPVMGSVLALARQRQRRKQHHINAWASSDSSCYSTASSQHSSRPSSTVSSSGSTDLSPLQATRK